MLDQTSVRNKGYSQNIIAGIDKIGSKPHKMETNGKNKTAIVSGGDPSYGIHSSPINKNIYSYHSDYKIFIKNFSVI